MSNEESTTSVDATTKKDNGSWDWLWLGIASFIIVKLFGLVGGLVTFGAYFWLKPRIGVWGAVAAAVALGVISAISLAAALRA